MAVYSMAAFERVFFSHIYRVNYVMNYFCFNLAKMIFTQIEKIIRYLNSASKSLVCSKRKNRKTTPKTP